MKKKTVECECYMFTDGGVRGIKPVYMTEHAACADVALPVDITIPAHEYVKIPLLIGFEIPAGYKVVMYSRSSLLPNYGIITQTGIIDHDYSGQPIHAMLYNTEDRPVSLKRGERILQVTVEPVYENTAWDRNRTERKGGVGSTGVSI